MLLCSHQSCSHQCPAQDTHTRPWCQCSKGHTGKGRGLHPWHSSALNSSAVRTLCLLSQPRSGDISRQISAAFSKKTLSSACGGWCRRVPEKTIACLTYPQKATRPPGLQSSSSPEHKGRDAQVLLRGDLTKPTIRSVCFPHLIPT